MTCNPIEQTDVPQINLIWGARNIGRVLGLKEPQIHYLLSTHGIPGAIKVGNKWCIAESKLREYFEQSEVA